MTSSDRREASADPNRARHAEAALRRLGFARVPAATGVRGKPEFWVQESGVPRRRFPVYLEPSPVGEGPGYPGGTGPAPRRAIVVVPTEEAAEAAWRSARRDSTGGFDSELSILIVPSRADAPENAHWHAGRLDRAELLRLATGVVVGLFRRAERGDGPVDFSEMLQLLRQRFSVDVHRSLGVEDDEDALFLLYQLAQRYAWAPGDGGANLHALVLKPSGPAARLPWFAA